MDLLYASAATTNAGPLAQIAAKVSGYWSTISGWIVTHWFELLIAAVFAAIFYTILGVLKRKAASIANRRQNAFSITTIIARTIGRTGRFFRVMVATELVNGLTNAPPIIARTIDLLFTVAVVIQVAIWLREMLLGLIERRAKGGDENETLTNAMVLIRLLISFALFAIAAIVILDNLGVNVTGLIAGLGVGGIAIGLAAQGIFSDLFGAISIILDRPFSVGDTISYDSSTATVEKIGMKSTRLRSIGGELLIISNSKLLDLEITNITMTGYRRTKYPIAVIYQTAPEKAREIPALLQKIVEGEGAKFVRAGFTGFGDSAINFELYFDVHSDSFQEVFEALQRIGLAIIDAFNEQGFEFAYPTQTTFSAAPDGTMVMPYAAKKP